MIYEVVAVPDEDGVVHLANYSESKQLRWYARNKLRSWSRCQPIFSDRNLLTWMYTRDTRRVSCLMCLAGLDI